jgi:hypothetical protein
MRGGGRVRGVGLGQSRGRVCVGARVRRSALWADCAVLLGLGAASRNSLRELRSLRSDNRDESDHEARCRAPAPNPALLAAAHARPQTPAHGFANAASAPPAAPSDKH